MSRRLFQLLIAAVTLLVVAGPVWAAPPRQGGNLLQNPGFEQPYTNGRANPWGSWSKDTPRTDTECLVAYHFQPKWNVETGNAAFIRDGAASQYIGNNWDTWSGGMSQTVAATPGTTYRFTFYGRARGTSEPSPAPSDTTLSVNMRAAIDPNGAGPWNDADVVWGAAGSPHDQWQAFTVETVATGNQITVYTYADWGVSGVNQCRQFLDTWYDSAELVAVAQVQPTQPPPTAAPTAAAPTNTPIPPLIPTEAAAATLAATLTAAPAETATPAGTATVCVNAFLDENGNGLHEAGESFAAGVTLTVAQGFTVIGQGVSSGTDTPLCFGGLQPGVYQVAQSVPATMEMTTQANATIEVGQGQTAGLEFGSRPRTEPPTAEPQPPAEATAAATVTPDPVPSDGNSPGWLAVIGFVAIAGGLALLGVLIYLLLRK